MKRGDALYPVAGVQPQVGLLDTRGIAAYLNASPRKVQDLVREGMPFLDLSTDHDPRRRPKRMLRFVPADVLAWLRQRGNGSGGAA